MNKRGQAALEYLMTYGWALIVIAIVVGVLVFIVSSPAGNIVCNSDDPAKMMVKASQVDSTAAASAADIGTIKVTNLTGGDISSVSCSGTGAFATSVAVGDGCTATVVSGAELTFEPNASSTAGTYATSTIAITYNDYASLSRSATITCSGPLTIT